MVYSKSPNDRNEGESKKYQVVVRVGEEIRRAIKGNRNKVFVELSAHRVVDRFYIKRCNNCQKFGHYEKDCENGARCGYCSGSHKSTDCQEVSDDNPEEYNCINCHENHKDPKGHSTLWHKCPTYLEMQSKMKKTIPYYQKN